LPGICSEVFVQLLEHEAKEKGRAIGLRVPRGELARSAEEVARVAAELGGTVVLKAQVPTGGRGKAGGIAVVPATRAMSESEALFGRRVAEFHVDTLLVEEHVEARSELYVAISIDARARRPLLLFSTQGGVDIEAHSSDVVRIDLSMRTGVRPWHVRRAVREGGADAAVGSAVIEACDNAFRLFTSCRADLVELNPLLLTEEGAAVAADVRISFENGERSLTDGRESSRSRDGYDFVEIDPSGDVGLITTGAGASMLLLDRLTDAGARPINFCDLRTGGLRGRSERLEDVLTRLAAYPAIEAIAVNVFAGVTDLQEFAELFVFAYEKVGPELPIVVRVDGFGADQARKVFADAGLRWVHDFDDLIGAAAGFAHERPATGGTR
jgi:succinyl-CoA synthetase beta subunit